MNNAFFDWLHDAAERALPVVCAFGLGVVVALDAARADHERWAEIYGDLLRQVETVRIACGAQPDPEAIAATLAAQVAEVQP